MPSSFAFFASLRETLGSGSARLGLGAIHPYDDFSVGNHVLTLSATNSRPLTATTTYSVIVHPFRFHSFSGKWNRGNPYFSSDFDPSDIDCDVMPFTCNPFGIYDFDIPYYRQRFRLIMENGDT